MGAEDVADDGADGGQGNSIGNNILRLSASCLFKLSTWTRQLSTCSQALPVGGQGDNSVVLADSGNVLVLDLGNGGVVQGSDKSSDAYP